MEAPPETPPMQYPKITREFLESALGCPIESFELETGSNPGDNYMSNLFGIAVTKKDGKSEHLLMKCFPNHPARQDFLQKANIFSKEVWYYSDWIPLMEAFQKKYAKPGVPLEELPFAKYYAGHAHDYVKADWKETNTPVKEGQQENFLLFADLRKAEGYRMGDRLRGLDLAHCELVMKELAKVHAYGWCYKQKNGITLLQQKFDHFTDTMFRGQNGLNDDIEKMKQPMTDHTLSLVAKAFPEGVNSKEYKATKEFYDRDLTAMIKVFMEPEGIDEDKVEELLRVKAPKSGDDYSKERWMFPCHGDSWVNNFLFKYDPTTGKPQKLKIVDLQMYREACPTTDLAYFFYASTVAELRVAHLDQLLHLYYTEFVRHCETLDTCLPPAFTFPTLKRRFHRAKTLGLCFATFLLQVILVPPEQSRNLDAEDESKDIQEVFTDMMMSEENKSNLNLQGRLREIITELYNDGVM